MKTWQQAVERYVRETHHKKSHPQDLLRLRCLDRHLGHVTLSGITRDVVEDVLALHSGKSPATYNRYAALIRAILRKAHLEWGWIQAAPAIRTLPETPRVRWITQQQALQLMGALPAHLEAPARLALATGLRKSNVFGLEWSQVDLARRVAWITSTQSKSRRALNVPLNDAAAKVLASQIGNHTCRVFAYRGRPLDGHCHRTWHRACRDVGIDDFRWHDLRHTWASWHVQAGTPIQVLMELGGWSDLSLVLRYAHLGASHLAGYAGAVSLPSGNQSLIDVSTHKLETLK